MGIEQTSKVFVVNGFGTTAGTVRTRTPGGKQRVTVDIKADALGVVVDPQALGAPIAAAIASAVTRGIKSITAVASQATLARRKWYAANPGAPSTQARYSGGRTGYTPPSSTSIRMFNDSHRLANGIVARWTRLGEFTINLPANRFNPATFGPGLETQLGRLFELVDVLRDPGLLAKEVVIQRAVNQIAQDIVKTGPTVLDVMNKARGALSKLFQLGQFRDSAEEKRAQAEADQQQGDGG